MSKKIAVILQRFRSVSVMQSRLTGLIMSSICEEGNSMSWNIHCTGTVVVVDLPDTSSLQMAKFQFQAAPFDAAVLRRNILTRTSIRFRHRRYPYSGTNTRLLSGDSYLLQLAGTIRSRCMTFAMHSLFRLEHLLDHGHASHNPKISARSFATRELRIEKTMSVNSRRAISKLASKYHSP